MKKLFKNWKFWVIVGSAVVVAIGGYFGISALVKLWTPVATPQNLCIIESAGNKYVMVDEQSDTSKYEFVFKQLGQKDVVIISSNNVANVTSLLEGYSNYTIKARAHGDNGFGDSKFCSSITYTSKIKVASPTLTYDGQNNRLYVELDQNYDFEVNFFFELYYNGVIGGDALKVTNIHTPALNNNGHGAYLSYFDLTFLQSGQYQLAVKVIPDDDVHFESSSLTYYSSTVTVE